MKNWIAASLAVGLFIGLFSGPGYAFFELGKSLKFKCMDDVNSHDRAFCMGYILGIADTMMEGNKINNFKACIPDSTTENEIWAVVSKALKENSGSLHYVGDDLVAYAYQEAFPCK